MTLGKVHTELPQESLVEVKKLLRRHMQDHQLMFGKLSHKQNRLALSLAQEPVDETQALLEESGEAEAPQSGAIFGILKQMKESFETNLASSQKEEANAKEEFGSMKSAKTDGITAANELIDSKTTELADTDEKLASSKEDLEDTSATLAADTEFLANLKKKCDNASAEYAARSKVRNEEIQAVSDTIGILTEDDAKDLLLKFIQVSSHKTQVSDRDRAA